MTSPTRLSMVQSIYDARAPKYDSEEGFHLTQAADYLGWMNITPGLKILDLACGTGAIIIPAAKKIGPSGKAVGVDISGESLAIARVKAERDNLDVKFIHHDIAALDEIKELEGYFDLIICASSFILLQEPVAVLKGWARLLKSDGRVIFDVPASGSMIVGYVLNIVGNKLKIPLPFDQTTFRPLEAVKQLLVQTGFEASGCFTTASYGDTLLMAKNADEMFEGIISRKEWFGGAYAGFSDPTVKEKAKEIFSLEMKKLAEEDGTIKEQLRFNMAIGKKA